MTNTMTFKQIVKELKDKATEYIEAGEIHKENLDYNIRQHALNDYMDEFMELANCEPDERERLVDDACCEVEDHSDELLEEISEEMEVA